MSELLSPSQKIRIWHTRLTNLRAKPLGYLRDLHKGYQTAGFLPVQSNRKFNKNKLINDVLGADMEAERS